MEDSKNLEIQVKDFYGDNCLKDAVSKTKDIARGPKGLVEIYELDENNNKKLVRKSNLVVYSGREWLASAAVRTDNTNITASGTDFISWFGLGDGGVLPSDPLDPIPPALTDTDLASRVMINASDASNGDWHVISTGYPSEGFYKLPLESADFEQDAYNDDKWLVLKITIIVKTTDANGALLSECGLYASASNTGGYTGPMTMFSRATFPSIVKTIDRRLLFTWYLYF